MKNIELILKGPTEAITILRIIQGELKNWGYNSSEITEEDDAWGITTFKINVELPES